MPFMKKDDMLTAAEALGVDLEGLSWPEQQKAVQEAMNKAGYIVAPAKYTFPGKPELDEDALYFESPEPKPKPFQNEKQEVLEKAKQKYINEMYQSYLNAKPVQITGEIKPMRDALLKWDEELGEELDVDDVNYVYNGHPAIPDGRDSVYGTYTVKGKTGRKVIGKSTMPHQNVLIYLDPHEHWLAPIVRDFDGREGYLWVHPNYKGIKQLLIDSGYYYDYNDLFKSNLHPQNIWMAGGKFYAVSIGLVEKIFREIEKKAKANEY